MATFVSKLDFFIEKIESDENSFSYICGGAGALVLLTMFICAACGVS